MLAAMSRPVPGTIKVQLAGWVPNGHVKQDCQDITEFRSSKRLDVQVGIRISGTKLRDVCFSPYHCTGLLQEGGQKVALLIVSLHSQWSARTSHLMVGVFAKKLATNVAFIGLFCTRKVASGTCWRARLCTQSPPNGFTPERVREGNAVQRH